MTQVDVAIKIKIIPLHFVYYLNLLDLIDSPVTPDYVLSVNLYLHKGDSGGVVNSLDFARHRLSPLAAFTSGAYFLHNGRR